MIEFLLLQLKLNLDAFWEMIYNLIKDWVWIPTFAALYGEGLYLTSLADVFKTLSIAAVSFGQPALAATLLSVAHGSLAMGIFFVGLAVAVIELGYWVAISTGLDESFCLDYWAAVLVVMLVVIFCGMPNSFIARYIGEYGWRLTFWLMMRTNALSRIGALISEFSPFNNYMFYVISLSLGIVLCQFVYYFQTVVMV